MTAGSKVPVVAEPQPEFGTQASTGAISGARTAATLARSPRRPVKKGVRKKRLGPSDAAITAARLRFEAGEATLVALAAELDAEFGAGGAGKNRSEPCSKTRGKSCNKRRVRPGARMSARKLGALRKSQGWLEPVQKARTKPASRSKASSRSGAHRLATDVGYVAGEAISQRPPGLVGRLWAAAERHMSEIEAALVGAPGDVASREREARLMAMLVRVAAGLAALERSAAQHGGSGRSGAGKIAGDGGGGNDASAGLPDDLDGFRLALEERIAALRQCGVADGVSGPPAATRSGAAGG